MHVYVVDSVIIIIHIAASICFAHRLVLERGGGDRPIPNLRKTNCLFIFFIDCTYYNLYKCKPFISLKSNKY